eukprot:2844999-Pleurochrysis_carterae.AAC.1
MAVAPKPQDIPLLLSLGRVYGDVEGGHSLQPPQGLRQGRGYGEKWRAVDVCEAHSPPTKLSIHEGRGTHESRRVR